MTPTSRTVTNAGLYTLHLLRNEKIRPVLILQKVLDQRSMFLVRNYTVVNTIELSLFIYLKAKIGTRNLIIRNNSVMLYYNNLVTPYL